MLEKKYLLTATDLAYYKHLAVSEYAYTDVAIAWKFREKMMDFERTHEYKERTCKPDYDGRCECGQDLYVPTLPNYCPNCGAKVVQE